MMTGEDSLITFKRWLVIVPCAAVAALAAVFAPMAGAEEPLVPSEGALKALAERPDDGPVYMLNLLKFKPDGGAELYGKYGAAAAKRVYELGGKILFYGLAKSVSVVPNEWDSIAIVEYPSRKAFLSLTEDADYAGATHFREEGLERTILYAFKNEPPAFGGAGALAEAPLMAVPPAPGPDAVYMLNLLRFKADGGEERYYRDYGAATMPMIGKLGGAAYFNFAGEQSLIGDDQRIDRMILVMYPSPQAFMGMVQSEAYRKIGHHRTDAIEVGLLFPFNNGTPSAAPEGAAAANEAGAGRPTLPQMVKLLDSNGDGRLQEDEAPEQLKQYFGFIDTNGDGAIDEEEAKAAEAMRGNR